ncbi:MAG TPA: DUF393 domain-containing protein [Candidatus Sulfomarinibacteraceae bacterium]|nr:DUF393 domain-containing protein [Candidatus Sulfomarinibacteraceae bacterium]
MTARWVERITKGRVSIQPWQALPPGMKAAGLSAEQTETEVWLLTRDAQPKGGAAAINAVLAYTWWGRPISWLYRLPLIRSLQDAVYRWVARNRQHFPGVTPACESDADCVE